MRTSEANILIIPGWSSSGEDHWQSRWEKSLKTAHRVEQDDWIRPNKDAWVGRIIAAVAGSEQPSILVAHSLGVIAVAHAAHKAPKGLIAGAYLVAPADVDNADNWPVTQGEIFSTKESGFAPVPLQPLGFPAVVVASSDDPYCTLDRARHFAASWGATFAEAGSVGHINTVSGHGPWPEGLLRFGQFLKTLD